ncbi:MAG TPA: hypothetical protein VN445_05720 [Rectinemataceae bacterium]|nr:hypothetical protein [Rectinemataceae bacterium]
MTKKIGLSERERETKRSTIYINERLGALLSKYLRRKNDMSGKNEGQSATITRIMGRYDMFMRIERRTIRDVFTRDEFNVMLKKTFYKTFDPAEGILGAVLDEAINETDSTFLQHNVDRETLIGKLNKLTPGQQLALVDWLEEIRAEAI